MKKISSEAVFVGKMLLTAIVTGLVSGGVAFDVNMLGIVHVSKEALLWIMYCGALIGSLAVAALHIRKSWTAKKATLKTAAVEKPCGPIVVTPTGDYQKDHAEARRLTLEKRAEYNRAHPHHRGSSDRDPVEPFFLDQEGKVVSLPTPLI